MYSEREPEGVPPSPLRMPEISPRVAGSRPSGSTIPDDARAGVDALGPLPFSEADYLPQAAGELPPGPWLVLAPHPDDESFGMGGALARARAQGIAVSVVVLTDGALGGAADGDLVERREREVEAALRELGGGELRFLRLPDRGLVPDWDIVARILEIRASGQHRSLFFPSALEPHPDHRAAAVIGWEVCRATGFAVAPYGYEISVQAPVNLLLDISAVRERKLAAMRCYASQQAVYPYIERIQALDRTRAWSLPPEVWCAEGFYRFPAQDHSLSEMVAGLCKSLPVAGVRAVQQGELPPAPSDPGPAALAEIARLRQEIAELRSSTSWRITLPLRALRMRFLQRRPPAGGSDSDRRRLLVVMATNAIGGAEVQTRIRMRGLAEAFEITILVHRTVAGLFEDLPVDVVPFETFGLENPFDFSPRNSLRYARAIARVRSQVRADVVYGLMHGASYLIALARLLPPWQRVRVRHIGSLHGSLDTYYRNRPHPRSWGERVAGWAVPRLLHGAIAPSRGVARELVDVFGFKRSRVHAIHNGFDFDRIRELGAAPVLREKRRPWVVTSCRLSVQKDFRTLLLACRMLQDLDFELVIVGEGEQRAAIEAWTEEFGLRDRVFLAGFDANPFRWMSRADVFVLSSFLEGFGNVLVEAMLLEVPVISTDCPWGPSEIIEDGATGLLVRIEDAAGLAQRVRRLLEDGAERRRLAANGRAAAERFSERRMIERYAEVFHDRG